jgi:hypothetical protein
MLMLVVTIIIAAVVSAFSGGLAKSNEKAPQMSFEGEFSIKDGLTLTHMGGDTVGCTNTQMYVAPGIDFGGTTQYTMWTVNKSTIWSPKAGKYWLDPVSGSGGAGAIFWSPGDNIVILPPYSTREFLQPGGYANYYFDNPINIGKKIKVSFGDSAGRIFATADIPIVS